KMVASNTLPALEAEFESMLGSQPLSSELSLPSASRLPDNGHPSSASLAAFTTIFPSPVADVWPWYRLASRDEGCNGLLSPFPVFGSPVVHGRGSFVRR